MFLAFGKYFSIALQKGKSVSSTIPVGFTQPVRPTCSENSLEGFLALSFVQNFKHHPHLPEEELEMTYLTNTKIKTTNKQKTKNPGVAQYLMKTLGVPKRLRLMVVMCPCVLGNGLLSLLHHFTEFLE